MKYCIKFYEYWHSGGKSGGGKDADSKLLKDKESQTPLVAAKTLNGLLRENLEKIDKDLTIQYLGKEGNNNGGEVGMWDAMLPEAQVGKIVEFGLEKQLYSTIDSTKITDKGTAEDKSLRTMEVAIPMVIEGDIDLKGLDTEPIIRAMGMIKELGLKRNRGFGRCCVNLIGDDGKEILWQPNT